MKSLIECRDAEIGVYYLRHASNMRHVRIALKGGRIVVSGPPCLSPAEAADIVAEKRLLLQRWLKKTETNAGSVPRTGRVADGTFCIASPFMRFSLKIVDDSPGELYVVYKRSTVDAPPAFGRALPGERGKMVFTEATGCFGRQALERLDGTQRGLMACRMYEAAARNVFATAYEGRVAALAELHGFKYSKAAFRRVSSRWGSCSARGGISLAITLPLLPVELSDYVVLHELTHTVHFDHSPAFWQRLDACCGGRAEELRGRLKALRPETEFFIGD
ncbi:MAG: M48 family metallopeptidase [Bacteroidales bacterium]|nr:M48 family metallopeptidase [Bacteroidales bacterium]